MRLTFAIMVSTQPRPEFDPNAELIAPEDREIEVFDLWEGEDVIRRRGFIAAPKTKLPGMLATPRVWSVFACLRCYSSPPLCRHPCKYTCVHATLSLIHPPPPPPTPL